MSLRTRFFALTYDRQIAGAEQAGLRALRQRLLAGASGDVIEIGGGTGANLPFYGPGVQSLTITEPQPPMLRRLDRKVREQRPAARALRAPAEDLPFDDHTFDVAVSTLVLCGVDDQPRALRELRRVLRPGGQLLFIEHLRSDDPGIARMQDRMNWLNRLVVCCDCNRPTLDSLGKAGFTVTEVEHTQLPKAPKFVRPTIVGRAKVADRPLPGFPRQGTSSLTNPWRLDGVELHPVQQRAVVDRARVRGAVPQRLPVRFPGARHVGVGDGGERDQLDGVHLDQALARAHRVPAAGLDLGPFPQPERHGDLPG
jgi:SAM-dependent methyltransferase